MTTKTFLKPLWLFCLGVYPAVVLSHGNIAPQPMNTDELPDVGEEWLTENPYRNADLPVWRVAVRIGASGYNQNCARCDGLEAVSGGIAPDLRKIEAADYGDEWFMERFRNGATQNGVTKMPPFEDLLNQKAAWAIRTFVETRPADGALDAVNAELTRIRDDLRAKHADVQTGKAELARFAADIAGMKARLGEIAESIQSESGAGRTDSIAYRAELDLDGGDGSLGRAADTLTIGLSAAR